MSKRYKLNNKFKIKSCLVTCDIFKIISFKIVSNLVRKQASNYEFKPMTEKEASEVKENIALSMLIKSVKGD